MTPLSRRKFLENIAMLSAGFVLPFRIDELLIENKVIYYSSHESLGRVFHNNTYSLNQPESNAGIVNEFKRNDILKLKETIINHSKSSASSIWHQLEDGSFIHESKIQQVKNQLNAPNLEVGASGSLAEVTVPYTNAWHRQKTEKKPDEIFYFSSTHWVYGVGQDEEKNYYYLIREDRWGDEYWVDATHMRITNEDELVPISPDLSENEKKITIYLREQLMVAFEKKQPVFMSPLASGLLTGSIDRTTPVGSFVINYKRPSRHMTHGERVGIDSGELFGVPWVSYFTDTGIAFHGTYWHNDFTKPKSFGCINLPIPAAKWVYLWSHPVISPRSEKHVSQYGSSVEIL